MNDERYDISRDGKSRLTSVATMKVVLQALQSMLQQLRLVIFLVLVFAVHTTTVSAGEWVLKEEWLPLPDGGKFVGTWNLSVPDESHGKITGHGKRTGHAWGKRFALWEYKISGSRKGDVIHFRCFNGIVSITNGDGMTETRKAVDWNMTLPLEDGYLRKIPLPGSPTSMVFQLSGSKIEKWRLVYEGYELKSFGLSNSVRPDGTDDQLIGGLKVYWTNTVDFKVRKTKKGRKYLSGKGTAKVTHTEPFSLPPGAYECNTDEKSISAYKGSFTVNGSISKSKLKLHLPNDNYFELTIDCLLDEDSLEKHLRDLAGNAILRDVFTGLILPHGIQSMNLVEHSETIHDYPDYGLKRTLRKLSGD